LELGKISSTDLRDRVRLFVEASKKTGHLKNSKNFAEQVKTIRPARSEKIIPVARKLSPEKPVEGRAGIINHILLKVSDIRRD